MQIMQQRISSCRVFEVSGGGFGLFFGGRERGVKQVLRAGGAGLGVRVHQLAKGRLTFGLERRVAEHLVLLLSEDRAIVPRWFLLQ